MMATSAPFLFLLRFFFGFGRHIGFFGVGGKLAAVILSLRACLQDENQKLNELVFITWATCSNCGFAIINFNPTQ